jgi:hypothetical protein
MSILDKIQKSLSSKLGIDEKVIAEKLGLPQDADYNAVANAFGLYKVFETKDSYTTTISSKNKALNDEITKLKTDHETSLKELMSLKETSEKQKTDMAFENNLLNKLIKESWNKNKIDGEPLFDKIDKKKLDYELSQNNLDKYLLKIAVENKINVKTDKPKLATANVIHVENAKIRANRTV